MTTRIEVLNENRFLIAQEELGRGRKREFAEFLEGDLEHPKCVRIFCSPKDNWTSIQIFNSKVEPINVGGSTFMACGRLDDLERSLTLRRGEAFEIPIKQSANGSPVLFRFSHK